jgi:hypothetical protein
MEVLAPYQTLEITGIGSQGLSDEVEHYGIDSVEAAGTAAQLGPAGGSNLAVFDETLKDAGALNEMVDEAREQAEQQKLRNPSQECDLVEKRQKEIVAQLSSLVNEQGLFCQSSMLQETQSDERQSTTYSHWVSFCSPPPIFFSNG